MKAERKSLPTSHSLFLLNRFKRGLYYYYFFLFSLFHLALCCPSAARRSHSTAVINSPADFLKSSESSRSLRVWEAEGPPPPSTADFIQSGQEKKKTRAVSVDRSFKMRAWHYHSRKKKNKDTQVCRIVLAQKKACLSFLTWGQDGRRWQRCKPTHEKSSGEIPPAPRETSL